MDIAQDGKIHGPIEGSPTLQNSTLGWIVFGGNFAKPTWQSTKTISYVDRSVVSYHSIASLENTINNFWELEEVPRLIVMSTAEQVCEEHYVSTHSRNAEGRYILRLPIKSEVVTNNSYWLAPISV